MAMCRNYIPLFLLILLSYAVNVENSKLNVPRVLLPIFKQFAVNFTLEATESGCYKWSSSRQDVVQINPINVDRELDCSTHAVVSAISKEEVRNTAIILAEEIHSGQVLRCDVIVDVINNLNIVTTTRELFMEEAPDAFEVRAYDDQGNEFSTLEGVEFQWSLGNWNAKVDHPGGSGNNVLRFITFRDSPYETPSTIEAFEQKGLRGHMVLLEGIKTGSAKVSVRLPHQEYQHLKPVEVQLMVVANLIIDPPDIYILEGDSVHYRILQVQHGKLVEIPMPSPQYFLEVEGSAVAAVSAATGMATALQVGKTRVLLHDRNVAEQDPGIRVPAAHLTVVAPAYLTLALLPHRNWAVMVAEHYEIVVEIYDRADHKLFIGAGVKVEAWIPGQYFHVARSSKNNTHHSGWPVEAGACQVRATLLGVAGPDGAVHTLPTKISAQAEMTIYQRIAVQPQEVVLPWDPTVKPKYDIQLSATGGDGTHLWSSGASQVASVTQSGLVRTLGLGSAEVACSMARNHHNREVARVHVLPPRRLEIVQYVLEAEVGMPVHLQVAVYADKPGSVKDPPSLVPFTRCQDLPFTVTFTEPHFFYNSSLRTATVGVSCATLAVVGSSAGTTTVTVRYTYAGVVMEDSVAIAAFKPLVPLHPASGQTVLAVGSSRHVVFSGGPRPWLGRPSEHVRHIDLGRASGDDRAMSAREVVPITRDQPDLYVYQVICHKVGQVDVRLTVTNTPPMTNCKRAEASALVKVFCEKPRYMELRPEMRIAKGDCPMNLNAERVVAQNYRDIELTVTVKDKLGRKFDNISSLFVSWKLSDPSLAEVLEVGSTIADTIQEGNVVLPFRHFQKIIPKGHTGTLEVTATIVSYQSTVLKQLKIEAEYPVFGITNEKGHEVTPEISATISLVLVNDTLVVPNRTSVFSHPKNKVHLQVSQGSGFYEFVLSSEDIADVRYVEGTRMIEVVPKGVGLLKLALVDVCLVSKPAVVEIAVFGIGRIQVESPARVERGKCVPVTVRLYDASDNLLPFPDPSLLELRALPDSDIISIKPQESSSKRELQFTVTGLELGDTSLVFVAGRGEREIQSQPTQIQVFPPLRLFPRNVTLVAGAIFQVTSRGGPQPDANVEYTMNGAIAAVSQFGVVEGLKLGQTTLTGRAVGLNSPSGQKIVFSQDMIEIHVVPLRGIKIRAPITRIRVGATMPVWASGVPDQITPLMLGAVRLPVAYRWSLSSRDEGELRNVFHATGIQVLDEDKISMRFLAVRPGRTIVHLNVTVPASVAGGGSTRHMQDSLEVEVFEGLRLTRPAHAAAPQSPLLLIAPDTSVQLRVNREADSKITYSVDGGGVKGGRSKREGEEAQRAIGPAGNVVEVDSNGLVTSHGGVGRAIVSVSEKENYGLEQILSVAVEVKPVSYMMMNVNAELEAISREKVRVHGLPQGLELELEASFHDNTGAVFTSSRSDLKLRTNRFDLVQLSRGEENASVVASLKHSGKTMLKVWDEGSLQHPADYIKIPTEDIIFPRKVAVSVGDVVCLSMPLALTSGGGGGAGQWATDNEAVLRVDPESGVGRALAGGSVVVRYHFSASRLVNSDIQVRPLHNIKFLPLGNRNVSNTSPDVAFRVPLVLCSETDDGKTNNLICGARDDKCRSKHTIHTFPFTCDLSFTSKKSAMEVLAVYPAFNMLTGQYSCDIIASGPPTLETSKLLTSVRVQALANGLSSGVLVIPFHPALYLLTPEIRLVSFQGTSMLTITGTAAVLHQVEIIADSVLRIGKPEYRDDTSVSYPVQLNMKYWQISMMHSRLSLTIQSALTQQEIEVPVKLQLGGSTDSSFVVSAPCLANEFGSWGGPLGDAVYLYRHTFAVIVSIIVLLFTTIYIYVKFIQPFAEGRRSSSVVAFNTSLNGSQVSHPSNVTTQRSPFSDYASPVYGDPHTSFPSPDTRRSSSRRFQ